MVGPVDVEPQKVESGIIFPPYSSAYYSTIEYEFTSSVNSIGLRDNEISPKNDDIYRILCFGDSWTYGWGVELENSWPKQLEVYLQNLNKDVEVINCGQGSAYPWLYAKYMDKAVPLLKPDLVIVGVLQIDDLAQSYTAATTKTKAKPSELPPSIGSFLKNFLKASLRNFVSRFRQNVKENSSNDTIEIKEIWKNQVQEIVAGLDEIQELRYYALEDTVKQLFSTGDLNPGLLNRFISYPEKFAIFNNPNHPATKKAIQQMNKDIQNMVEVNKSNGSPLIFASMPLPSTTGHKIISNPYDQIISQELSQHNQIDSMYRSIARSNRIDYVEFTEHFKNLADKSDYFFKFDSHPNEKGYQEIAKVVGQFLNENELLNK